MIYQVNLKWKETTAGLVNVRASCEEEAYTIAIKILQEEGGTDFEVLGCQAIRTDGEQELYLNSLN